MAMEYLTIGKLIYQNEISYGDHIISYMHQLLTISWVFSDSTTSNIRDVTIESFAMLQKSKFFQLVLLFI